MYFSSKLSGFLLAVAASALTAQASAVVARTELAELSVVFFDDVGFTGAAYSPSEISPGVCSTLPGDWLSRPESVIIGAGFSCTFFAFTGCEGPGHQLSGSVSSLPTTSTPPLYNNIESFSCNKQI